MRHDHHMTAPISTSTLAEAPELTDASQRVIADGWPAFVLATPVAAALWPRVLTEFADYQVVLVDQGSGSVVGTGHSLPLAWDGTVEGLPAGWDAAVERAIEDHDQGRAATAAVGLSATIARGHRGRRLSRRLIQALRAVAADHGHTALVLPVRPNLKSAYPLIPIERYVTWTAADGAPFDPWLRVHWRLGGRIVGLCPESMRISAPVADWEGWTGMRLPDSGRYVVPDALVPIEIDRERDQGLYLEPNVWVHHDLRPASGAVG
jgi:GNAT superfamily N-acetyltransferase